MNRKKLFLGLFFCTIVILSFSQEKYTVSGYVKDFKTEEPIIGAAVFELNNAIHGTPTDSDGYFSLDFPEKKVYIKFAYIGFKDTVINLVLSEDTVINIFLKTETDIEEVEIEDDKISWQPKEDSLKGDAKIIFAEQKNKKEPIKVNNFVIPKIEKKEILPPISELFLKKGKGTNQILTFIDGARLYSTTRSFDLSSLLNPESIQHYDYFYGNFPANYGGYLSPVLDVTTKEGDNRVYKGGGTIGLFGASIYTEGPVIENKSSFFVATRRTFFNNPYTDVFRKESTLWAKPVSFDVNFKYTHQLNESNKFNLSFFTNRNSNTYETQEDTGQYIFNRKQFEKTGNILTSLRWKHIFSPNFVSEVSFSSSRYNLNYKFEGDSIGLLSENRSRINDYDSEYVSGNGDIALNINLKYNLNSEHFFKFGLNAYNYRFRPIKASLILHDFIHENHIDTSWNEDAYSTQEYIVFAEDKYIVSEKLTLHGGIHFSAFKTSSETYYSVQPRIYATYKLFKNLSLNASYSNYKQYIHLLSGRQVGLSSDIFFASDETILPQFTHHASAGIKIELPFKINLIADAFYNKSINVSEYKSRYNFFNYEDKFVLPGKELKSRIEQGTENSYGLRILLNKRYQKFTFKLADYISVSDRVFENLNFAQQFSYRHNNVNDFTLDVSYKINENFNVGINWQYRSGNFVTLNKQSYIPYNFITGTLSISQTENPVYSINGDLIEATDEINAYRLPAYNRADFFVNYVIENNSFGLRIYNVFNRKNPDFVDFERGVMSNTDRYQLVNYTNLSFFPTLSYTYRF